MRLRRTSSGIVAIIIISLVSGACAQQITVNPQPIPQPKLSPEQLSKTPISASQVEKFRLTYYNLRLGGHRRSSIRNERCGIALTEISPPNPNHGHFADVSFVDAKTGWVLLASQTEGDDSTKSDWEADWAFYVSRTTDGGRIWSETHVQMPASKTKTPSLSDNGYLTFSDRLHGSLMLEHQSGSAFHFGSLLVTSDGGRTWQASDKTAQVLWRNSCSARSSRRRSSAARL